MAGAAVATAAAAAASTAAVAAAAVAAKAAAASATGPVAQSCLWLHGLSWSGPCFHARLIFVRMYGLRPVEYKVLRDIGRGSFCKVCLARAYTAECQIGGNHLSMRGKLIEVHLCMRQRRTLYRGISSSTSCLSPIASHRISLASGACTSGSALHICTQFCS